MLQYEVPGRLIGLFCINMAFMDLVLMQQIVHGADIGAAALRFCINMVSMDELRVIGVVLKLDALSVVHAAHLMRMPHSLARRQGAVAPFLPFSLSPSHQPLRLQR